MRPHAVGRWSPVLVALVALVAAACGDDDTTDTGTAGAAPTTSDLDGRAFVSESVSGHQLAPGTAVSLEFTTDRIVADAGCNTIAGGYSIDGGVLAVETLAMTEMGCPAELMDQDQWLAEVLDAAPTMSLDGDRLVVDAGEQGSITMVDQAVVDPDLPVEGTLWIVDGIVMREAVSSVPEGVVASLTVADGTALVETGCNTGSGEAEVGDGTITFGPIAITLRACAPEVSDVESAVLAVLVGEVSAEVDGDRLSLRRDGEDGPIGLELVAET